MKKILYILLLVLSVAACRKQPVLKVDTPEISLPTAGGTTKVTVTANYPWSASASNNWISVTYKQEESMLTVKVSANSSTDARQGSVTLTCEELTCTIRVTQAQRDAIELDSSGRISIEYGAQKLEVLLKSNTEFTGTVTDGADWVSILSTKAMVSHTVTLDIKENETTAPRRATVVFKDASGTVSQQITITQTGRPQILKLSFENVQQFQVPLMKAISGTKLTGNIFWDTDSEGIPYDPSLTKEYDGASGSLRFEGANAGTVSFSNLNGITSIDLSKF